MKDSADILFTIITVCYNAEDCIVKTIQSLLMQTYRNYEYIIQDGQSKDGTLEIINSVVENNSQVVLESKKDKGIYDAMNQAIRKAKGDYVFFLNAGDCLSDAKVLDRVNCFLKNHREVDVCYGNILFVDEKSMYERKYGNIARRKFFFLTGDCICHQAMFSRNSLFKQKQFDINYKVCADKEWELYLLTRGYRFKPMKITVAAVLTDGYSRNHIKEFEKESLECLHKYCSEIIWIYYIVIWLKKNPMSVWILRKIEKLFFTEARHEE